MTPATPLKRTMRDTMLSGILAQMDRGENIIFLSADFGAPALDAIRERHTERFINVGISEQNLINVATGFALEGFTVYAYAIAPFITMRCCEQIRVNLAILSQVRPMNVNLIGVGAGFSYEVSGPTHHCLEDISIMRTFPNVEVLSPSDLKWVEHLPDYCLSHNQPKYLRFDAKPVAALYEQITPVDMTNGFKEMFKGSDVCLVSSGIMTHKAQEICHELKGTGKNFGVVDILNLKHFNETKLVDILRSYRKVISLEEGFIGKGGIDALVGGLILKHQLSARFVPLGLNDQYIFHIGSREDLHSEHSLGREHIVSELLRAI